MVPAMTATQAMRGTGEKPGAALAVSTKGLTKRFGDRTVVDRVDLAIPAGSVCGFVGPNGAGKTTTIRMLLGLIRPTAGSGSILGGSLTEPATYLRKVGALIEAPAFYPQLSGRDNLRALARLGQLNLKAIDPVLARVGLGDRAGDKYRSYSLGMKQRLGIAAALLPEIEQICDYVVMIRAGRLVHQGRVADLRATQQRDVIAAPEHDADLEQLAKVLAAAGCTATMQPAENTVRVETAGLSAADLNRLVAGDGMTLRQLAEQTRSLERAFFALTGTDDAGLPPGQEMGAI